MRAGYRYNPRSKSRLMFLINDMGLEAFRAEVTSAPITTL